MLRGDSEKGKKSAKTAPKQRKQSVKKCKDRVKIAGKQCSALFLRTTYCAPLCYPVAGSAPERRNKDQAVRAEGASDCPTGQ